MKSVPYITSLSLAVFLTAVYISPNECGELEHSETFTRAAVIGVPAMFVSMFGIFLMAFGCEGKKQRGGER